MNVDEGKVLMLRFQRTGDSAAGHALFQLYRDGVWRFLFRLCQSEDEADDLSQKVWLRLMGVAERGAYRTSDQASFKTYLFTIARNIFIDQRRAAAHHDSRQAALDVNVMADSAVDSSESLVDRAQWQEWLSSHFDSLPGEQQDVLSMWLEGFSFDEIAAATGASRATVIGRKRYGIENLRKCVTSEITDRYTRIDD